MYKTLDAPLSVHLELTTLCNQKCCHCYNFWRESGSIDHSLSTEQLLKIIDQLEKNRVFHVILNGGEPLLNKNVLLMAMVELNKRNISFSLNSNGLLLNKETCQLLKNSGLNSILISLLSSSKAVQEQLSNTKDSFKRIVAGICSAKQSGLIVAVNMVVCKLNLNHVFETGMFVKALGIKNFNATRVMPPQGCYTNFPNHLLLNKDEVRSLTEQLVRLRFNGLEIGSLVPYPLCFLDNEQAFEALAHRTCSAGKASLTISSNGDVRTCTHLQKNYGNIFEQELSSIWKNMSEWRDGSLIPEDCHSCKLLPKCGGGCRVSSEIGKCNKPDILMIKPFKKNKEVAVVKTIKLNPDSRLRVFSRCRFRKDSVFGIINTGGVHNVFLDHPTIDLFQKLHSDGKIFTPSSLQKECGIEMNQDFYLTFLQELLNKNVLKIVN